jgi:hypothetical protein
MVRVLTSPKPELASPRYGFGFVVGPEPGVVGHSGGFVGVAANVDLFLDDGYTAILLSNDRVPLKPVVRRVRELVLGSAAAGASSQARELVGQVPATFHDKVMLQAGRRRKRMRFARPSGSRISATPKRTARNPS